MPRDDHDLRTWHLRVIRTFHQEVAHFDRLGLEAKVRRQEAIRQAIADGVTPGAIGLELDVSRERVRQYAAQRLESED